MNIKNRDNNIWYNRLIALKSNQKKMYLIDTNISDHLLAYIYNYMQYMQTDYIPIKMMEKQLDNDEEFNLKEELKEIRYDFSIKGILKKESYIETRY